MMKKLLRENGLSIVLLAIFLILLASHSISGFFNYNQEQQDHGQPAVSYLDYLKSGDFIESVGENWESEFLQMGLFVFMTKHLYQKGSSESKDPDGGPEPVDEDPRKHQNDPDAPWPVRKGGWILSLYEHSLSIVFLLLFVFSMAVHALGGWSAYNEEQAEIHKPGVSLLQFIGGSRFWFESFQNWQSEFLAILAMVVLSIFLRERSSPQSKPVHAPHSETEE